MFTSKPFPILTATICHKMEQLRLALEVLTGERVRFFHFDFNTRKGAVLLGEEKVDITTSGGAKDRIQFWLHDVSYIALFEATEVKVAVAHGNSHTVMTVVGECPLRWVGTSMHDRREEPLFLRQFQSYAKARGMTVEELIHTSR